MSEARHVAPSRRLHHERNPVVALGSGQKVGPVVQERTGVNRHPDAFRLPSHPVGVHPGIPVLAETGRTVAGGLDDVAGHTRRACRVPPCRDPALTRAASSSQEGPADPAGLGNRIEFSALHPARR